MIVEMAKANDAQESGQSGELPMGNLYGEQPNNLDLPSYGMSHFVNMGDGKQVKKLLNRIRKSNQGEKVLSPSTGTTAVASTLSDPVNVVASTNMATLTNMVTSTNMATSTSMLTSASMVAAASMVTSADQIGMGEEENEPLCREGGTMVLANPDLDREDGTEVVICVQDNGDSICYNPFQFTAGGTQPLLHTVDPSQIESLTETVTYCADVDDSALFGEGIDSIMIEDGPSLEVKSAGYSRFRYESERNTANKRPRQYEMDEEKRFLAEIEMKNYIGRAKVIVYCVNGHGQLHPYKLFGTDCHNGVFVRVTEFTKKHPVTKLLKVSVTTPKTKEYVKSVIEQRRYLEEHNVITENDVSKKGADNGDKQVVYLMVKVLLEDGRGTTLAKMTKEIRNKKEGTEFRIRTVIPSSAPIWGSCEGNPDKTKICVIVTENTAFPKDVCVVMEKKIDDGIPWTRVLQGPQIEVIKKAVVEFIPPQFREPSLTDVEVELYLQDMKTGQKTEPATFTFVGTDEYGIVGKGKKRKLRDSLLDQFDMGQQGLPRSGRKTLTAMRKRTSIGKEGNAATNELSDSSPENSLTISQSQPSPAQPQGASKQVPMEEPEISIGGMRQSTVVGSRPQAAMPRAPVTVCTGQMATRSHTAQPSYTLSQPDAAIVKQELKTPGICVSSTPAFPATPQTTAASAQGALSPELLKQIEPFRQYLAQKENKAPQDVPLEQVIQYLKKAYEKQMSGGQAVSSSSMPSMTTATPASMPPPQPVINPHVSSQLPKLKPNQMLAVISGQIVILNNDLPGEAPLQPNSAVIQDIGGQEVMVQKMPPQQPSSERDTPIEIAQLNPVTMATTLQQPATLAQTTLNYTMPALQNMYGYQQAPAINSVPMVNPAMMVNQTLQQPVQAPNPTYNQQFSNGQRNTVPWHNYSPNLEDDDIEIDSGAAVETDTGKTSKRPKSDQVNTAEKVMEVKGREMDEEDSYQNLPKIITDVSEESEGEDGRKDTSQTSAEGSNIIVLISSSDAESDSEDMQS